MTYQELLLRLGLALAIGLLVDIERHWREREAAPDSRTAGIRNFGLSGLLGGSPGSLPGRNRSGAASWGCSSRPASRRQEWRLAETMVPAADRSMASASARCPMAALPGCVNKSAGRLDLAPHVCLRQRN